MNSPSTPRKSTNLACCAATSIAPVDHALLVVGLGWNFTIKDVLSNVEIYSVSLSCLHSFFVGTRPLFVAAYRLSKGHNSLLHLRPPHTPCLNEKDIGRHFQHATQFLEHLTPALGGLPEGVPKAWWKP